MPSPFTWDITKPAGGDALNIGDNQIRTDKTSLRDVLRTLVPYGTPTVGWRNVQISNVNWLTQNASYDGANFNRDDVALAASAFRYNADGSIEVMFVAAGANPIVWTSQNTFKATGAFLLGGGGLEFNSDNVFDVGTSAFRGRDIYVGTSVRIGTTVAAAGAIRLANAGAVRWRNAGNTADLGLLLTSGDLLQIESGLEPSADGTLDLATASKRFRDVYVGTSVRIGGTVATSGFLRLAVGDGVFWRNAGNTNNEGIYRDSSLGNITLTTTLMSDVDASDDLGTSAFRFRDGYFSASVKIGTNPATAGAVRLANNTGVFARNAGNSADRSLIFLNASDEVEIGSVLADNRWGPGSIALGGGAGATLGTIGGSGPTAAAQSSWIKVNIGGSARFIPIWA